jgi:hypothetical protein
MEEWREGRRERRRRGDVPLEESEWILLFCVSIKRFSWLFLFVGGKEREGGIERWRERDAQTQIYSLCKYKGIRKLLNKS